jgi:GNAT superfamily N-acetyltransferase
MLTAEDLHISLAGESDLPALANLLEELFTLEAEFQPDRQKQLAGLKLVLDNPDLGRVFVMRVDGKVAGMANALITVSTAEGARVLLLEDVIVRAEYRGHGLGRKLIQHVLDWAKAEGMMRVTLLADKDNISALGFYERLGFRYSSMRVLRREL